MSKILLILRIIPDVMSEIQINLKKIKSTLPENVKLVAVSKTRSINEIIEIYNTGHRVFGENRVQEIVVKQASLPADIQWHLIGHLQTNKVKYIAPFISLIESVDSFKLLVEINKQASKFNRLIDCLLQFHIASEETKFGLSYEEAEEILESPVFASLKNIRITGVMGMATLTENQNLIRSEFSELKKYFNYLKMKYFENDRFFKEISMGMSDDYPIAIEEGSTMVRVGSSIFGSRFQ